MSNHTTRTVISTGPTPVGPYSPAIAAAGLIHLSGMLPLDDDRRIVGPGDLVAQTRRVVERVRGLLVAAGSSLEQVVSVTVYLKSAAHFATMNEAYRTFWPHHPPTRTTVIADLLDPDALIEVSLVAVPNGVGRAVIHPTDWQPSPSPYSYGIRSNDTVFLSGLVSRNGRDNTSVPGDVSLQTRVVLDNAGELLHAEGLSHANIVSVRVFLPDSSSFEQMNTEYRRYFPSAPPARATVRAGLAASQYRVEMTIIASAAPRHPIGDGPHPNPNLSAAIRTGHHVYLSGMLGNPAVHPDDAAAQTRETLEHIRRTLADADCSPADVIDSLVYLTDLSDLQHMNDAYRAFFQHSFPARTTVRAGLFVPHGRVEIMMVAAKP
jgi:2-iminobutanoate/2-iminopropanoate deaminase